MNNWSPLLDDIHRTWNDYAPQSMQAHVVPTGLLVLAAGLVVCVLGAKLARFGVVGLFAILGGALGAGFAAQFQFNAFVCVIVGAALIGAIAGFTFRLWVGVATGALVASVAMGLFSFWRVLPHLSDYTKQPANIVTLLVPDGDSVREAITNDTAQAPTGPVASQPGVLQGAPATWTQQYWAFVKSRDANVSRYGTALGAVATLIGLLVGLIFTRACLIAASAGIGTLLALSGAGALMAAWLPSASQAAAQRPAWVGVAVGAVLATSIIVQTMLTRKPSTTEK